jgi:hypothetical protein
MFVISSRTGEMPRSVCSCLFGTYHGALTIVRSTLFWNLCKISILDVLADPPNGAPYKHNFSLYIHTEDLKSPCSFT